MLSMEDNKLMLSIALCIHVLLGDSKMLPTEMLSTGDRKVMLPLNRVKMLSTGDSKMILHTE